MAIRVSPTSATSKFKIEVNQLTGRLFVCYRYSVIELHTFLVTLIRHFDFYLPNDGRELEKTRLGAISPVVVGEEHKGPQLPLKVTILGNA
jgi:hypothetical protein